MRGDGGEALVVQDRGDAGLLGELPREGLALFAAPARRAVHVHGVADDDQLRAELFYSCADFFEGLFVRIGGDASRVGGHHFVWIADRNARPRVAEVDVDDDHSLSSSPFSRATFSLA